MNGVLEHKTLTTKPITPHKALLLNKTKTYLLLAAVLGVWGTISYKIINGMSPDIPEIAQQEYNVSFKPKAATKMDTFSIQKVDKDPFLGTLHSKQKNTNQSNVKAKSKINIPNIIYSGVVKKQNASNQVFVVTINNIQHLLKQGQVVDSISLIKGNTNAITIRYKNKTQIINRK